MAVRPRKGVGMLFGHQHDTAAQPVQNPSAVQPSSVAAVNPLAVDPATGISLPTPPPPPTPLEPDEPSVLDQPTFPVSDPIDPEPTAPLIDQATLYTDDITTGHTPATAEPLDEPESTADTVYTPTSSSQVVSGSEPTFDPSEPTATVDNSLDDTTTDSLTDSTTTDAVDTYTPGSLDEAPPEPPVDPIPTTDTADSTDSNDLLSLKQQALAQLGPLVDQLDQTPEERFRTTMMLIQSTDNQSLIPAAYEVAQTISDEKARAQALLDIVNEINYFTQQAKNS